MELYHNDINNNISRKKDEFEKQIIAKYDFPFLYMLVVERDFWLK